jgi:formamidopyrimidine-DNA glycosylase
VPEILEVEAARRVLAEHALEREITKVYAPDSWFLKRGTTAPALRHALVGNAFVAARRRGKQIVLDTRDPDVRLGLHLGMSGRVLVDDPEATAQRPKGSGARRRPILIYASNRRVSKWHRFGVHFADGGEFMLRDPRRLGAVELDPDEDRLGPDAMEVSAADIDRALGRSRAPIKAVLMDQHRIAGLGNLLVDEILWRAGIDPNRPPTAIDAAERKALHRTIRATLRTLDRRGGSHTGDLPRDRDRPCPRDGRPLARIQVGGRTTFWCPAHQH